MSTSTTLKSAVAVMMVVVVLFAGLFETGIADTIVMANKMKINKLVGIYCHVGFKSYDYDIEQGNKTLIELKNVGHFRDLVPPARCLGQWEEVDKEFTFVAYSESRDHNRCSNKCYMELRDLGLYGWNSTVQVWELVYKWPVHIVSN
ncbi:hypothetical protein BVC80_1543g63 [Macleaya cordata]|uniref:S-protein homolog n=1 Tax=Macleaya cordata TaxID=56857 RepID=A0A200R1M9_MACCD|nr:hypothetical protein BVC80_1543g63 [Macleaya cordata]